MARAVQTMSASPIVALPLGAVALGAVESRRVQHLRDVVQRGSVLGEGGDEGLEIGGVEGFVGDFFAGDEERAFVLVIAGYYGEVVVEVTF